MEKTIGAACLFAGELLADGAVRYTLERELYLGPLPGQDAAPAQALVHVLHNAGLQALYSERMHTVEWSKFVGWLGFTTLAVLTRLETYKFLSDPHTARIGARVMREAGLLAAALGVPLEDRPPLPSGLGRRWLRRPGGGRLATHGGQPCVRTLRRCVNRLCKTSNVADALRSKRHLGIRSRRLRRSGWPCRRWRCVTSF